MRCYKQIFKSHIKKNMDSFISLDNKLYKWGQAFRAGEYFVSFNRHLFFIYLKLDKIKNALTKNQNPLKEYINSPPFLL
jgi:hypothetical protein